MSFFETVKGLISNTVARVPRIDPSTNAWIFVTNQHKEVHSGTAYVHRAFHNIVKNGTFDHLIITPNTTKWGHVTISVEGVTSSIEVMLYEDTTVSANGALMTVFNRNRNYADNNTMLIYGTPTVTGVGTLLADNVFGAGKNSAGGGGRDGNEIVLKQNTLYLLRVNERNIQATDVNFVIDWYEHTDKD